MNASNQSTAAVFAALKSSPAGLGRAEIEKRRAEFGPNELQEKEKNPPWRVFLAQFKDFMILVLAAAAIVSGAIGELTDTIVIFVIVVLNAVIGFVQEYRAEKTLAALKKMTVTKTPVVRENRTTVVSSTELVPGDVVELEAGAVVPADLRLFEVYALRVDESSLTGESVPVDKTGAALALEENAAPADRTNIAFKGTLVTSGRARGVAVATGMRTELGRIAGLLQENEAATPLQRRMAQFGRNLSYIILLICLVLFLTGVLRGEDPFEILLVSISLAVAAIPEALPALITIALARGASRLARQNALIRKLPAVETLGSVTYICTDKTGTLTENRMRVVELYEHPAAAGDGETAALRTAMALNHDVRFTDGREAVGDPTETAIVEHVVADGSFDQYRDVVERYPRASELPFDSDRKCMTTVHRAGDRFLIVTKGAAEAVAATLRDPDDAKRLTKLADEWAGRGIRVLAFAGRHLDALPAPMDSRTVEKDLAFFGLTGLIDPARDEVKKAIEECRTAGIKPVMITGDHPATARAIAAEIGILGEDDLVLTGAELKRLDDDAFLRQVEQTAVYARVSPDQKLRIVRALQEKGHFAAMTGDGVNDAPSLKAANIGVAMGVTGTDVSKEAAHLVLLDDNFATIVRAVREGRRIFDNIRKFVKYIMTCNSAEILSIAVPPLIGLPVPLLPIQILWINLVTDGLPALALAGEQAERDVMKRPPRPPRESLFADGVGGHIVRFGLLMAIVTIGAQAWAIHERIAHWQTIVFTVLSLSQLGHVLAIRSDRTFLYKQGFLSNGPLFWSVFLTFWLQLAVVYLPFMNEIFKTAPLSAFELLVALALSAVVFHAVELEKWLRRRFSKSDAVLNK